MTPMDTVQSGSAIEGAPQARGRTLPIASPDSASLLFA